MGPAAPDRGACEPEIPPAINDIILKVLSKEPAGRYRTADQLGRVLQSYSDRELAPAATARTPTGSLPDRVPPASPPRPAPPPRVGESAAVEEGAETVVNEDLFLGIDWVNVILGIVAIIAAGGLIPFWIWVYYVLNGVGG